MAASLFIDTAQRAARATAASSASSPSSGWVSGRVTEVLDSGWVEVAVPADDPQAVATAPSDGTLTQVGAVVRVLLDSSGRATQISAPATLDTSEDAAPVVFTGAAGARMTQALTDARQALDGLDAQAEAAAAAQSAADQARVDAVAALKAAEESSVFSATAPESPRVGQVWYELNAAGAIVGIHVWDGSAWLVRTLAAGQVLVPGSVGSTLIGPGSVTTREIDVDDLWAEIVRSRGVTTDMLTAGGATITGTAVVGDLEGNTLRGGSLIAGDSSTGTARITTNASGPYIQFKNSADEETFFVDSAGTFRMVDRVRGGTVSLDNFLSSWTSTTNLADTAGGTVWTRPARTSLGSWSNFLGTQYRVMSPTGKLRVEHRLMYNESTLASDIYIQIGFYRDPPTMDNITSGLYSSRAWAEFHAMTGITMPSFTASEVIVVPANTWFYVRPIWRYQAAASGSLTDVRYWTQTTPV